MLDKAKAAYDRAQAAYDAAHAAREKNEPELGTLRLRLQEAVGKEERLAGLMEKADGLRRRVGEIRAARDAAGSQLAEVREHGSGRGGACGEGDRAAEPAGSCAAQDHPASAVAPTDCAAEEKSNGCGPRRKCWRRGRAGVVGAHPGRAASRFCRKELEVRLAELARLEASPPENDDELARDAEFIARVQERIAQLKETELELARSSRR